MIVITAAAPAAESFPPLPVAEASMTTTAHGNTQQMLLMTDLDLDVIYNNFEREEREIDFHKRRIEDALENPSADFEYEGDPSSQQSYLTSNNIEDCTVPAGKCVECTFSEQRAEEACHETGKWQQFECIMPGDSKSTGTEQEAHATFIQKSCKYTDFDEGMAMFRLQLFCYIAGLFSMASVRKQKRLSSSMFDQRRQQGAAPVVVQSNNSNPGVFRRSGSRVGEDDEEIEFTPMTNQQRERVPLVERMEII